MTRYRWLARGLFSAVAVTAVVVSQRGSRRITVDTVRATRQSRFVSTVTASGEIVATRYADIGSIVMGNIVSLPVAEGERVLAGQVLARIVAVQAESDISSAQVQVLALAAALQGAREQVQAAMADAVAAEARAADAEQQFGRKKELFGAGLLAAAEFATDRVMWAVAAGLTVSVCVGVAAGYWPAQRAAALDPVEALRHE